MGGSKTSNINDKPSKFLGASVRFSTSHTKRTAGSEFKEHFSTSLQSLTDAPIKGEYKVWIYKRYLIPSLHFFHSVNGIPVTITSKMNSLATCYITSWWGLCCSTTVAVIHHPLILNIPALDSCSTSAKLFYLSAITLSPDPLIKEISHNALSVPFGRAHGIAKSARDVLRVARESLEYISKKSLGNAVRCYHREYRKDRWRSHLLG